VRFSCSALDSSAKNLRESWRVGEQGVFESGAGEPHSKTQARFGKSVKKKLIWAVDTGAEVWSIYRPFGGKNFMYAVLETGSKQYRVTAGDTLEVERLEVEAGKPVTFDRVLLVSADGKVTVGSPTVANASVVADVVDHIRGEKKVAFKMKRRKGYHKTIGHRQELTVVKIKEIKA
jgi:large subunit ribosomal protein L21